MSPFLTKIALIGVIASVILAGFGVWLAFLQGDSSAESTISFFGLMDVKTANVGVALIALGIAGILVTIRRVLKSFDILLKK